jgi:hypothetical protein
VALLLGIAVPVLDPSRAVANLMLVGCGVLVFGDLGLSLFLRHFEVRRRAVIEEAVRAEDAALPLRNDARDLADELEDYAQRLQDWYDARDLDRPQLIEENTVRLLRANGKGVLAETLRVFADEPERVTEHNQATAHFDRTLLAEYLLRWRAEGVRLIDRTITERVVAPSVRADFIDKPDRETLKQLPDNVYRRLAGRLRLREADQVRDAYTANALGGQAKAS